MYIMPHINSMLKDLFSITSNIVVKNDEVASSYEDNPNTIDLYNKCLKILNNSPRDYTYIPNDIIRSISQWKVFLTKRYLLDYVNLAYDNSHTDSDGTTYYISTTDIDKDNAPGDIGDYYIWSNNLIYDLITKDSLYTRKTYINFLNNDNIYDSAEIKSDNYMVKKLYIRDFAKDKYVAVNCGWKETYEQIGDHRIVYDKDKYIERPITTEPSNSYVRKIDGEPDNTVQSSWYRQGMDSEIYYGEMYEREGFSTVIYVYDKEHEMYRVRKSSDTDELRDCYIKFILPVYKLADSENCEYTMFREDFPDMLIPYYYESTGEVYYYPVDQKKPIISETAYDSLVDDEKKNYLPDKYVKYKCTDMSAVDRYEQYRNLDGEYTDRYERNPNGELVLYDYITPDELSKVTTEKNYDTIYIDFYKYTTSDGILHTENECPMSIYAKYENSYNKIDNYIDGITYFCESDSCVVYKKIQKYSESVIDYYSHHLDELSESEQQYVLDKTDEYYLELYSPKEYRDGNKYSSPIYTGETNTYYRLLNGLPEINAMDSVPVLDRKELNFTNYKDRYVKICFMTDYEISVISKSGLLDRYKTLYPEAVYLNYLGENRIDVMAARGTSLFGIIRHGPYYNENIYDLFINSYIASKEYVFSRYFAEESFGRYQYFSSFITFAILTNAIDICLSKSGDILYFDRYNDYETAKLKLAEYGMDSVFNSVPLSYRIKISKYMKELVRNKGSDLVYDTVKKIFNVSFVEIYQFYLQKIKGEESSDLKFIEVPLDTGTLAIDIDKSRSYDYDDVTDSDIYWGTNDKLEEIKNNIMKESFDALMSKYISIKANINLNDIRYRYSMLLNYLLDNSNSSLKIPVSVFDRSYEIKYYIMALIVLNSFIHKTIPLINNSIDRPCSIYKFNIFDETLESEISEKIKNASDSTYDNRKYAINKSNISNKKSKDFATEIVNYLKRNDAIEKPKGGLLKDVINSYLYNINEELLKTYYSDAYANVNILEDKIASPYVYIKKLRTNTLNNDFYNALDFSFNKIQTAESNSEQYEIDRYIWEPIANYTEIKANDMISASNVSYNYYQIFKNYILTEINSTDKFNAVVNYLNKYISDNSDVDIYKNAVKINPNKLYDTSYDEIINNNNFKFAIDLNALSLPEAGLPSDGYTYRSKFVCDTTLAYTDFDIVRKSSIGCNKIKLVQISDGMFNIVNIDDKRITIQKDSYINCGNCYTKYIGEHDVALNVDEGIQIPVSNTLNFNENDICDVINISYKADVDFKITIKYNKLYITNTTSDNDQPNYIIIDNDDMLIHYNQENNTADILRSSANIVLGKTPYINLDILKTKFDNKEIRIYEKTYLFNTSRIKDAAKNKLSDKYEVFNSGMNAIIGTYSVEEFNDMKMNNPEYKDVCFYFKIVPTVNDMCDATLYYYTKNALSYSMYLREKAPDMYSKLLTITHMDEPDRTKELQSAYSSIIDSLYNTLSGISNNENLNLTIINFEGLIPYIKLLINVFKSYSVDIYNISANYIIDDIDTESFKYMDYIFFNDYSYNDGKNKDIIHFSDDATYASKEIAPHQKLKITDEILFTWITKQ